MAWFKKYLASIFLASQAVDYYNISMKTLSILIMFSLVLAAGCQTTDTSSDRHYDQVSREIERLKTESESAASIGDNIKIVVNFLSTDITDRFAIDSMFHYTNENITIAKQPEIFAKSGLRIGVAGPNFKARLDIIKQQLKSSEESELFIVLADGATGYINIGQEIYVPQFYYLGRWYRTVDYQFRQAGRSLKVTVNQLPSGLIDMELTPVFSKFLSDGGDLELTELSTRVTAQPSQTLVIGGADTTEANVATALLSYDKQGRKKQTLITVTPHTK